MWFRASASFLVLALSLVSSEVRAGESLGKTLQELQLRYENGSDDDKEFEIPEEEANLYIRDPRNGDLPDGVESPWVRFEKGLAIVGATVDLDKFQGELPDSMLFQLLSGRVPVEVTARLAAEEGVGTLDLERVLISGVELPRTLVQMLARGDGASAFLPPGFKLGEPFAMPYDVERLRLQPGALFLLQRATVLDK